MRPYATAMISCYKSTELKQHLKDPYEVANSRSCCKSLKNEDIGISIIKKQKEEVV